MIQAKIQTPDEDLNAPSDLLDRHEVARLLRVNPRTLDRWHLLRIGPPRISLAGHKVRYRRSALNTWLSDQVVDPVPAQS